MERELRIVIVADTNNAEAREVLNNLSDHSEIPQTVVTPQLVRNIIPIRANPAIGVMFWSTDLQGMVADVEAFAAYIKGEAEIKAAAHTAQRYVPDEVAFAQPRILFEKWDGNGVVYEQSDIRLYGEEIYRCITAHTSQSDWTPDAAVSLWVRIADPTEAWPEWIQPLGAHDAYASGAKVAHNGKHWTSEIDANTYEPGVYGWKEVTE